MAQTLASVENVDTDIKQNDNRQPTSSNGQSLQNDASRSVLTRSNIGAQSMQKLTGNQSRAQLMPQADMANEVQVSPSHQSTFCGRLIAKLNLML